MKKMWLALELTQSKRCDYCELTFLRGGLRLDKVGNVTCVECFDYALSVASTGLAPVFAP